MNANVAKDLCTPCKCSSHQQWLTGFIDRNYVRIEGSFVPLLTTSAVGLAYSLNKKSI